MQELADKINLAENLRERGRTVESISLLTEVIKEAETTGDNLILASALGHRIVCYKHLYQNTGDEIYLELMEEDIGTGVDLDISENGKAVFYLRYGDVNKLRGYKLLALDCYEMAFDEVKKGGVEECEFAGHYAEALVDAGQWKHANELITEYMELLDSLKDIREFHRCILISGLCARKVKALLAGKRYFSAVWAFFRGYILAWKLKLSYKMPQRLNQYHQQLFGR
jgi:tetratricopeptide (TPR) repeat protein